MLRARPLGWRRAVTTARRSRPLAGSRRLPRGSRCAKMATSWSPRSSHTQNYCLRWTLPPKPSRRRNPGDDCGSATVVAAAMVAVLLCVSGAGAYVGSAVVARHRAQAAADLAALAAAARMPSGVSAACARATAVARQMRADGVQCEADDLDVVVTVQVTVFFGGAAQAAARAGPVSGAYVVSARTLESRISKFHSADSDVLALLQRADMPARLGARSGTGILHRRLGLQRFPASFVSCLVFSAP
jgi:secretion/DNA translocation related TadE-like protein